jgi:hypothetical protein
MLLPVERVVSICRCRLKGGHQLQVITVVANDVSRGSRWADIVSVHWLELGRLGCPCAFRWRLRVGSVLAWTWGYRLLGTVWAISRYQLAGELQFIGLIIPLFVAFVDARFWLSIVSFPGQRTSYKLYNPLKPPSLQRFTA